MSEPNTRWRRIWGEATAVFHRARRFSWLDLFVMIALAGLLYGLVDFADEWTGPHRLTAEIDLSPWALPQYTLFSLSRGLIAYLISLAFTLVYGYWAAKDAVAGAYSSRCWTFCKASQCSHSCQGCCSR